MRSNAPQVVTCNDYSREVTVSQNIAGKHFDRVFTFDKVLISKVLIFCFDCFYHSGKETQTDKIYGSCFLMGFERSISLT